jgi:hypothetical protein
MFAALNTLEIFCNESMIDITPSILNPSPKEYTGQSTIQETDISPYLSQIVKIGDEYKLTNQHYLDETAFDML